MDKYDTASQNSTRLDKRTRSKHTFAEQMAADVFRNNYVHPDDRDFVDRAPSRRSVRQAPKTWHRLGDVLTDILHDAGGEKDEAA